MCGRSTETGSCGNAARQIFPPRFDRAFEKLLEDPVAAATIRRSLLPFSGQLLVVMGCIIILASGLYRQIGGRSG